MSEACSVLCIQIIVVAEENECDVIELLFSDSRAGRGVNIRPRTTRKTAPISALSLFTNARMEPFIIAAFAGGVSPPAAGSINEESNKHRNPRKNVLYENLEIASSIPFFDANAQLFPRTFRDRCFSATSCFAIGESSSDVQYRRGKRLQSRSYSNMDSVVIRFERKFCLIAVHDMTSSLVH